ncbi:MAG: yxlF [Proteobacteria bacterium]|nr:yxlF [Pseudomonadota bacterium]
MTDAAILTVEDLTIRFGAVTAIDGVSLSVMPGERVAVLGHNGAGKSTLFKTVLGFLKPAAGRLAIVGAAPGSNVARRAVSYLPEQVVFPKGLTGTEVLTYFARLKGVAPKAALPLLETVGIAAAANRAVGTYSKGMRQRLGLAQALIGAPRLLLLDEPTSGLDPVSRHEFYDVLEASARAGTSVLLSSHSLSEIENRIDRIAIMAKGQLRAEGSLAELSRQAGLPVQIRVEAAAGRVEAVQARLGGERVNGQSVVLTCRAEDKVGTLARLAALGPDIVDIGIALPDLDDVYRHYSGIPIEGAAQ